MSDGSEGNAGVAERQRLAVHCSRDARLRPRQGLVVCTTPAYSPEAPEAVGAPLAVGRRGLDLVLAVGVADETR
jgi:hypothetical protein